MTQIVLVDDERNVVNALARVCRDSEIAPVLGIVRIAAFVSPYGALDFARHHRIDVVVSDYRMPEMNGVMLLTKIRSLQPDAARIVLSANADREAIIQAVNEAAIFRYVAKPWDSAEVKRTIADALAAASSAAQDRSLADETRASRGSLTPQELALRQLEAESPGITHVELSEDGGVLLVS
jgi:response regulator RpfG family c-di-GMP phosphodiesterase